MTHAEKTAQQHAANTAFLAGVYGTDATTFESWQYERGLQFIARQCKHNGITDEFARELEVSPMFWRWFMYQCKLIDCRFMAIQVDLVQQYTNGCQTAQEVLPKAYTAWINDELKHGEAMAYAYANFIGEYIDSLPVTVKTKNNHK